MKDFCSAIVVAAGSSSRMGEGRSKIFLKLGEKTVIENCLETLEKTDCIDEIIIVCRSEDKEEIVSLSESISKCVDVVIGGKTRRNSVENGLKAVSRESTLVAIHDAARPLVEIKDIEKVVSDAKIYGAAALAAKVKDTIKVVSDDGFIVSTPERRTLWAVQTPQVFKRELYEKAVKESRDKNEDITDDCQMVERLGNKVYITKGEYTNIKITTPEDISVAEAFWREMNGK